MASLRLHFANFILRHRVKRKLAAAQSVFDVRRVFNAAGAPAPAGVQFSPAQIGGISGEWAEAEAQKPTATLLYLHGGGYVSMSPRTHRAITGAFALRGFRVFAADYRLAPEHVFPGPVEDAVACWNDLREQVSGPLFVAGDSAGGGLALALMLSLRDQGLVGPDAACLFSPWTDLALTGASLTENTAREAVLSAHGIQTIASLYLAGADARAPLASPLYGDYSGIAPLQIFVGDGEILRDDSQRLAARVKACGAQADLHVYHKAPHVWQALIGFLPEARQSMDEAALFLRQCAADRAGHPATIGQVSSLERSTRVIAR